MASEQCVEEADLEQVLGQVAARFFFGLPLGPVLWRRAAKHGKIPSAPLYRTQLPRLCIDQRRLDAEQGVSTILQRVEANARHPHLDEAGVLAGRQPEVRPAAAGEQELPGLAPTLAEILVDRLPCLFGDRPAFLLLSDRGSIKRIAVRCHIIDAYCPATCCRWRG